jgi:arsenite methyltransferase
MTHGDERGCEHDVRVAQRRDYGSLAQSAPGGSGAGCCGTSEAGYEVADIESLPSDVAAGSLGCGDPVSFANLRQGQTVLDLGAGGGMDCFLAARRVGETGRVIGVDMTPEMLERARANRAKIGAENVEFRLGEIEHLPLADESVDVVLSNCVINLSPDKRQVLREAHRVLRPDGVLAISDMMVDGPLPEAIREALGSCGGGFSAPTSEDEYREALEAADFVDIQVERRYPDPTQFGTHLEHAGSTGSAGTARAVIAIGETGEVVQVVDMDDTADRATAVRSFSGNITARKPATPV